MIPGERMRLACWFWRLAETVFFRFAMGRRDRQHARGVRSPEIRRSARGLFAGASLQYCLGIFAIKFRDEAGADLGRTNRFAFVCVRTIAEAFRVHRSDHTDNPLHSLWFALRQKGQM